MNTRDLTRRVNASREIERDWPDAPLPPQDDGAPPWDPTLRGVVWAGCALFCIAVWAGIATAIARGVTGGQP